MGLFDGILGGVIGGEMVNVVGNLIQQHGGVQGLVAQFEKQGLGGTVQSWVGNGPNQSITPEQVHQGLGADMVKSLAAKAGIPVPDLLAKLSAVLPQAVDKLTPNGTVPAHS